MARQKKESTVFREFKFTVEGDSTFPLDMLRYECACPATTEDAIAMKMTYTGMPERRRVVLRRFARRGESLGPQIERWASYGWRVVGFGELRRAG